VAIRVRRDPRDHQRDQPNGRGTRPTYDLHGNTLSSADALGRTTTATYNGFDLPESVTNPPRRHDRVPLRRLREPHRGADAGRHGAGRPDGGVHLRRRPRPAGRPAHDHGRQAAALGQDLRPATGYLLTETDPIGRHALRLFERGRGEGPPDLTVSSRGRRRAFQPSARPPPSAARAWATTRGDGTPSSPTVDGNVDCEIDAVGNRTDYAYDAAGQLTSVGRADGTGLVTEH